MHGDVNNIVITFMYYFDIYIGSCCVILNNYDITIQFICGLLWTRLTVKPLAIRYIMCPSMLIRFSKLNVVLLSILCNM